MRFAYTPEEEAFRKEVKQFLAENVTPALLAERGGGMGDGDEEGQGRPHMTAFMKKVMDRGWVRLAAPKEYAGHGGDLTMQFVLDEEFSALGLPSGGQFGSGFGQIMKYGTDEQKSYFLPRMLSGEISMGLGFTEPGGGADLAGLQTRAVRDGDDWVIDGQKMFGGRNATHMYLMARTDPNVERHRGISIFLVPTDTPGFTVRPIRTVHDRGRPFVYGGPYLAETFYDNVRLPQSAMLGPENQGWYLGAEGLAMDRIGIGRFRTATSRTDHIVAYFKDHSFGDYVPREDPAVRDKLAELWIERQMYYLMVMRSLQMSKKGMPLTIASPAEKVWGPEHNFRAIESIAQMLGPYTGVLDGEESVLGGEFGAQMLSAYAVATSHGSAQVMRDSLSRRGLGMPRGS